MFRVIIIAIVLAGSQPVSAQKQPDTEITIIGDYKIVVRKFEKDWKMVNISTVDRRGAKKDEIEFIVTRGSADDCGFESQDHSYRFSSESQLIIEKTETVETCGLQQEMEESDEEFMNRIIDPYDILGKNITRIYKTTYEVSGEGKFIEVMKADSAIQSLVGFESFSRFPKSRLKILRNTIFARNGYKFKSDDLNSFFRKQSWYKPEFDNVDDRLTDDDKKIINYIKLLESK